MMVFTVTRTKLLAVHFIEMVNFVIKKFLGDITQLLIY